MKNIELTIAFLLPERTNETPLQVNVFKAMTNQRAITIQISSPQDNQPGQHYDGYLDSLFKF